MFDLSLDSGLATNRNNRSTPRDSDLPLTCFVFSSTSSLLLTVAVPLRLTPRARSSELASAPDLPPTGKTCKTVKERVCFYCPDFVSQHFFRAFICFVFNRVQLVHRRVPKFCAIAFWIFAGCVFPCDFSGLVKSESLPKTATLELFDVNISAETASGAGFGRRPTADFRR